MPNGASTAVTQLILVGPVSAIRAARTGSSLKRKGVSRRGPQTPRLPADFSRQGFNDAGSAWPASRVRCRREPALFCVAWERLRSSYATSSPLRVTLCNSFRPRTARGYAVASKLAAVSYFNSAQAFSSLSYTKAEPGRHASLSSRESDSPSEETTAYEAVLSL